MSAADYTDLARAVHRAGTNGLPATILRLIEENRNLRTTVDADLEYQRRLEARLAAVEALADVRNGTVHADNRDPEGVVRVSDLRAVLSAAPTDTTKETS